MPLRTAELADGPPVLHRSTGLGRQLLKEPRRNLVPTAEGVSFTTSTKEELAYPVRSGFEDRTIRFPSQTPSGLIFAEFAKK
jgi:hypothetical protein